jgi:hypothetical protein
MSDDKGFNIFVEAQKIIMTDKNAMAFAKLMNTPLKELADVMANNFEQFVNVVALNFHNADQLKKAVQAFINNQFILAPMVMLRMMFRQK